MLTRLACQQLAEQELGIKDHDLTNEEKYCILDEYTKPFEFGWIFYWNSNKYIETGDFQYALVGNGPLLIDKFTGVVFQTGTGLPVEHYIDQYLAEYYANQIIWSITPNSQHTLQLQKVKAVPAIKKVFEYTSKEALNFMNQMPNFTFSEGYKLRELQGELAEEGIEIEIKRTVHRQ